MNWRMKGNKKFFCWINKSSWIKSKFKIRRRIL